jgi:hypothetical protein
VLDRLEALYQQRSERVVERERELAPARALDPTEEVATTRKQTPAERAERRALEQRARENAEKALRHAAGIPEPEQQKKKLEQERGIGRGGMGR